PPEMRELQPEGEVKIVKSPTGKERQRAEGADLAAAAGVGLAEAAAQRPSDVGPERRIYPFGVSRQRLLQAMRETRFPGVLVDHLDDADVVVTLRPYYRRKPQILHDAEARSIPIYVVKSNTVVQLEQVLLTMRSERASDPVTTALKEAEDAIGHVLNKYSPVDLNPQNAYIRRLQHMTAQRYNLSSRSVGKEPNRFVRITPGGAS
ncbi:MAG TPA: R3H domain-containing nucleic acid-binding protein, partial [Dehalococcoidia bacterium]